VLLASSLALALSGSSVYDLVHGKASGLGIESRILVLILFALGGAQSAAPRVLMPPCSQASRSTSSGRHAYKLEYPYLTSLARGRW